MLNSYHTYLMIMPEEKSLIVKLAVPVAICVGAVLCVWSAYHGWVYTTWSTAQEPVVLAKVASVLCGAFALFTAAGYYADRAGYKQEELDRWGDDALAGKPPF